MFIKVGVITHGSVKNAFCCKGISTPLRHKAKHFSLLVSY